MDLSLIQKSLLLATFFRGNKPDQERWISCADQVVTLSLYYTGQLPTDDIQSRFTKRGYVGGLYDADGMLLPLINDRYAELIELINSQPQFIQGGGDLESPAYPTFTACRLTDSGASLAPNITPLFPDTPDFPSWPNSRTLKQTQ